MQHPDTYLYVPVNQSGRTEHGPLDAYPRSEWNRRIVVLGKTIHNRSHSCRLSPPHPENAFWNTRISRGKTKKMTEKPAGSDFVIKKKKKKVVRAIQNRLWYGSNPPPILTTPDVWHGRRPEMGDYRDSGALQNRGEKKKKSGVLLVSPNVCTTCQGTPGFLFIHRLLPYSSVVHRLGWYLKQIRVYTNNLALNRYFNIDN